MLDIDVEFVKEIVSDLVKCKSEVYVPIQSETDIIPLITQLRYQHPILFHLGEIEYCYHASRKMVKIIPRYTYAQAVYDANITAIISRMNSIKSEINTIPNSYNREIWIHDFLCKNVLYDDCGEQSHNIVGPLIYGRGVCDGISKCAKLMFQVAGIDSCVICGTAKSYKEAEYASHAWNLVCVDNEWSHLDITFDNTLSDRYIRYDYFNLSTEILNDHIVDSQFEGYIAAKLMHNDYYKRSNLLFFTMESAKNYICEQLLKNSTIIQIRMNMRVSPSQMENLFRSCIKRNTNYASYKMSYNEVRSVYCWELYGT